MSRRWILAANLSSPGTGFVGSPHGDTTEKRRSGSGPRFVEKMALGE